MQNKGLVMSYEKGQKWIDAIDLISPNRFDIMFKYMLASLLEKGISCDWAISPYEHHLKVWNNLVEQSPRKDGIEEYVSSFKGIIKSIKENGYDENQEPVPVDHLTNSPLNGAHRIAASLLTNNKVFCDVIDFSKNPLIGCHCDYRYLLDRNDHVQGGLSTQYADLAAHQYAKLKDNVRIISVFPSAKGFDKELDELINSESKVVYSKQVSLTPLGAFNFIRYIYDEDASRGNDWLGSSNNSWSGAQSKFRHCFPEGEPVKLYWFEEKSYDTSVKLKEKIRDIFKIGKHSVHINDTHTETLSMSGYLLNPNGLHFLNKTNPRVDCNFDYFFDKFKTWLITTGQDVEDFCVDSSAVLSAYGLRDCRDLDFLYHGSSIDTGMQDVSCHNDEMKYYQHTKEEIIFNPQNHFYYKGIKFANLGVVKAMKQFRNEEKDIVDVKLIDKAIDQ